MRRYFYLVPIFLFVISSLVGCSKDEINEPAELKDIKKPLTLEKKWKFSAGDGDEGLKLRLEPAFSSQAIYTADVDGEINAIEKDSGDELWSVDVDEQVSAGLGIDSQYLYYATFQGELVCLDRQNGSERWRKRLTSEVVSAPVSNGAIVAVQTIDGKLFAFNVAQGIQRWRYDSSGPILSLRGTSSPLVTRDRTVATFANGQMIAVDNQNGFPLWKADIGIPQGRTELERLVDVDGGILQDSGLLYAVAYQGKLAAIDAYSGQEVWNKPLSSFNGLSLSGSALFATNEAGDVFSLSTRNGSERWKNVELQYRRLTTPVAFDKYVVISDFEGYLHVLNQLGGEIRARVRPDSDGVMYMKAVGDVLYVYTRSGDLIAYELGSVQRFTKTASRREGLKD